MKKYHILINGSIGQKQIKLKENALTYLTRKPHKSSLTVSDQVETNLPFVFSISEVHLVSPVSGSGQLNLHMDAGKSYTCMIIHKLLLEAEEAAQT